MRCLGKQQLLLYLGWVAPLQCPQVLQHLPLGPKAGCPQLCSEARCCPAVHQTPGPGWKCTSLGSNLLNGLKMRAWSQSCGSGFPFTVDIPWLESKPRRERLSWGKVLKSGKLVKILKCNQACMKNVGVKLVSSCWRVTSVDKPLAEVWGRI